jgi:hypothetical protein
MRNVDYTGCPRTMLSYVLYFQPSFKHVNIRKLKCKVVPVLNYFMHYARKTWEIGGIVPPFIPLY